MGEIKQCRPDLPAMMGYRYDDEQRRQRASQHGANGFIMKPVDFDFLKEQLRRLPTAPM